MGLFSRVGLFLRDYGYRYLHVHSVRILRSLLVIRSPVFLFQLLHDPSAATVEIIDTTQPEEIIIDPAEGAAIEM